MEHYLVTSYTFNTKLYLTNLISIYDVKEIYSAKTLHIHGSYYANSGYKYQNVHFEKLKKIKAKVVLYGNCYVMFYKSKFNGVISTWNTQYVTNMCRMFYDSQFNGVISDWNTSSVTDMSWMFKRSQFNGVISDWVTSSVTNMSGMFCRSKFNGVISNWDVSSVTDMTWMFYKSKFVGGISK